MGSNGSCSSSRPRKRWSRGTGERGPRGRGLERHEPLLENHRPRTARTWVDSRLALAGPAVIGRLEMRGLLRAQTRGFERVGAVGVSVEPGDFPVANGRDRGAVVFHLEVGVLGACIVVIQQQNAIIIQVDRLSEFAAICDPRGKPISPCLPQPLQSLVGLLQSRTAEWWTRSLGGRGQTRSSRVPPKSRRRGRSRPSRRTVQLAARR